VANYREMGGLIGRWVANIGSLVAKLVVRLLAAASLWVRIQTSLKTKNGRHKQRSSQPTLARQKIYKKYLSYTRRISQRCFQKGTHITLDMSKIHQVHGEEFRRQLEVSG
jgi:hypothetical protein